MVLYYDNWLARCWHRRIAELEDVMERMEDEHGQELNKTTSNLKDKTAEAASLRVDVEKLRVRSSFCRV